MDDIRGIFDMALAVDRNRIRIRREQERRELQTPSPVCGSCAFWMTDRCPREALIYGRKRGPACEAPKCDEFQESLASQTYRNKLLAEIDGGSR